MNRRQAGEKFEELLNEIVELIGRDGISIVPHGRKFYDDKNNIGIIVFPSIDEEQFDILWNHHEHHFNDCSRCPKLIVDEEDDREKE